jgi:hypothetical protein
MNLKEFKQWLEQFPDDVEVEIVNLKNTTIAFEAKEYFDFEFIDFNGNEWVNKEDTRFGKKYLILGSSD